MTSEEVTTLARPLECVSFPLIFIEGCSLGKKSLKHNNVINLAVRTTINPWVSMIDNFVDNSTN